MFEMLTENQRKFCHRLKHGSLEHASKNWVAVMKHRIRKKYLKAIKDIELIESVSEELGLNVEDERGAENSERGIVRFSGRLFIDD